MARRVQIIGVPIDLGTDRRGVDMGPSAIRAAGLKGRLEALGLEVEDAGNIQVPVPESRPAGRAPAKAGDLKYQDEILEVSEALGAEVEATLKAGKTPLVLGGDHSLAIGSLAGVAAAKKSLGLLWFDAHADYNIPETSPSGNIHGMPLAISQGLGPEGVVRCRGFSPKVRPERTVLVGVRNLDPGEAKRLRSSQMTIFTMKEVDQLGMQRVMEQAIQVAGVGTSGFHVSFDLDVCDPDEAPGVGTPVRGGLTYREAHLAAEVVAEASAMVSLDLVEVNPILDSTNRTGILAVSLALSFFGKRIL